MKNIAILAIAGAACLVASCSQQQQQQQTTAPAPAPVVQAKGKYAAGFCPATLANYPINPHSVYALSAFLFALSRDSLRHLPIRRDFP